VLAIVPPTSGVTVTVTAVEVFEQPYWSVTVTVYKVVVLGVTVVGFVVLPPLLLHEYVYVPEGLAVAVS
jgi:hypothetical protein